MNPTECILAALRSLSQNKVRSFLTTLGVIIGVMSVILLVALGEAAQAYIRKEFSGMGTNVLIVSPGKQETTSDMIVITGGSFRKLTYDNAKEIKRKAAGIKGVSGNVLGSGQIRYGTRQRNCLVIGVMADFDEIRQLNTQIGRFISDDDIDKNNRVVVIGTQLRKELFGTGPAMYEKITINRRSHTVVGILEEKGQMLGVNCDDLALIPLPSAQQMFNGGEDKLMEILVSARSEQEVKTATSSMKSILTAAHDYTEDFTITDQDGMIESFDKIFRALRFMLAGIACISLLVGGIGIMNIMLVSVRERTREVGIRKAVGAKRKDIGMQFLVEAVTLSILGGSLGIATGYVGTVVAEMIYPSVPVSLSLWSISMAFLFSLSVGVFFGVYPALKASGVDPVEALRYE
jgi:putative ABC transport system permease protein